MDNVGAIFNKFFGHRNRTLWERFPGYYRSLVVETNDPLSMMRVRFKCPDMHDFDLKPDECPWAVPSFDLGGPKTGRFSHPCIGDWVWITFERQHPYGPIWTGFADPTRRRFYAYPQIFQVTPLSVDAVGKPDSKVVDFDEEYLPKDGRPMAHGWSDRYGNLDISSAVGFFPKEHDVKPPPPDYDAVQGSTYKQQNQKPEVNSPDKKYMAKVTKYGNISILGDQGYYWKKEEGSDVGEFEGDFTKDESFEIERYKLIQKLLNENVPTSTDTNGDQRRIGLLTRYGHKREMRDVGWAQMGPIQSKSRPGEFGAPQILSKESVNDFRWIKDRTKGGMLFQMYDKGFDPDNDEFIKRNLLEEVGHLSEREDLHWANKDARQIRYVTRYGIKFVLDDRGSHKTTADTVDNPRGNGWLAKSRRSPGVKSDTTGGDPRGYFIECNDNDEANHTMWGSPMGSMVEINDRYQYMMMATTMGADWTAKWRGIEENEFIGKPAMMVDPELNAYHLKLDLDNEYLRLKTRGGKGTAPKDAANQSGVGADELNQGFEARDGMSGDGPWVEMVDCQKRGMWLSKKHHLGIWRAGQDKKLYMWMDDDASKVVIYNGEGNGTVEVFANGNINIINKADINISGKNINIRADQSINMQAGSKRFTIANQIYTNAEINTPKLQAAASTKTPSGSGTDVSPTAPPTVPSIVEPTDRAKTYNGPFTACPRDEIEHPI